MIKINFKYDFEKKNFFFLKSMNENCYKFRIVEMKDTKDNFKLDAYDGKFNGF